MGLDIKKYSYSYSMLHRLRAAALKVDKLEIGLMCEDYKELNNCGKCFYCKFNKDESLKTNFDHFIYYYDNEGGYISKRSKQSTKSKYENYLDLDKLKEECEILNKNIREFLNDREISAWNDYYDDVMSSKMILSYC